MRVAVRVALHRAALLLVAVAGALLPLAGDEAATGEQDETAAITQANAGNFSPDAIILAAGLTQEPWLSAETAAMLDADLARIRARFPQVQDVHAGPDFILTGVFIGLDLAAPWLDDWKAGALPTGDAVVDGLLSEFHAVTIRDLDLEKPDQYRYFVLTFAQPLNMPALAQRYLAASNQLRHVGPKYTLGDGDRITIEPVDGIKRYTFSRGWGDCPAGCINRHFWEVTLLPYGRMYLREYGDLLSKRWWLE